ncbi:hypothetical protein HH308_15790 [Gordonia sp. TBRC 11910]|uniref:LGFP repeat-containing protein n=1 Tax=Gordonia asplenii TaxID=2725283 RepID=A0A848KUW9_9ACTN|nr:hypothetical protein [Gordonia asplenii]NMO02674.1 hypothetical protein [Gordonia asplenii]
MARKHFWKSTAAAVMAAAAIGSAVSVPALASAAPPAGTNVDYHLAGGEFTGTWSGHGRTAKIYGDRTASISLAAGARDGETWNARWYPTGRTIQLVLTHRTYQVGHLDMHLYSGYRMTGRLKRVQGYTVLELSPLNGIYWCKPPANSAGICGA